MTRKQKKSLRRIILSAALYVLLLIIGAKDRGWLGLALFLIPYAVIGWDVLWRAVRNIRNGQVFDENFLMAVATVGAFGCGEYLEAVAVMLFYQVGELFQSVAVSRSRKSISDLMDIRPDYANVEREGALVQVDPEEVAVGDTIVIKPGERVPLDGVVAEGTSALDTAALTGESLPRRVSPGQEVISGCINQTGVLRVKVSKPYGESTVAKILDLVENSAAKKAKAENFIPLRPVLHPGGGLCRPGSGHPAPGAGLWPLLHVGAAGADLPGGVLPLRSGHLRAPQLLRRHRRRIPGGCAGERGQLSGGPG